MMTFCWLDSPCKLVCQKGVDFIGIILEVLWGDVAEFPVVLVVVSFKLLVQKQDVIIVLKMGIVSASCREACLVRGYCTEVNGIKLSVPGRFNTMPPLLVLLALG